MSRLYHVTLTTGDVRWSPLAEVRATTIAELTQVLAECERNGSAEFPSPTGLMIVQQLAPGASSRHTACWTVREPQGPALVTFGVAVKSRPGAVLWRELHAIREPGVPIATRADDLPPTPWLAVLVHLPLMFAMQHADWIGDFERCLAWAWIESRK